MHVGAIVVTDAAPDQAALEALLQPWYVENEVAIEPMFDYFTVGGRFRDLIDSHASQEADDPLWSICQMQKKALDLPALEARAVAQRAALWDKVHAALAGRTIPDPAALRRRWADQRALLGRPISWSDKFHADPGVVAVLKAVPDLWNPVQIAALGAPRELVLELARRRALLPGAIVVDGTWHEFPGFFYDDDPAETARWEDRFKSLLAGASEESWLTVIDYHR